MDAMRPTSAPAPFPIFKPRQIHLSRHRNQGTALRKLTKCANAARHRDLFFVTRLKSHDGLHWRWANSQTHSPGLWALSVLISPVNLLRDSKAHHFSRRKKTRCPGEKPVCSFCERLGQNCIYSGSAETVEEGSFAKSMVRGILIPHSVQG
jgi:hypothetical protein